MIRKYIVAALILAPINFAYAEPNWAPITSSSLPNGDSDAVFYVDVNTIRVTQDGHRMAWMKTNYETNQHNRMRDIWYMSVASLYDIDCNQEMFALVQQSLYSNRDMTGEVIDSSHVPVGGEQFEYLVPGSVNEQMVGYVCNFTFAKK